DAFYQRHSVTRLKFVNGVLGGSWETLTQGRADIIVGAMRAPPMENGAIDYAALVEGGARMGVTNQDDPYEEQKRDLLAFASTA
ncbi:hypothetical protein ONN26_25880, partial [Salmonella enterica subsp. enterica serovar Muenster]|nr:hypothetical protein [Salmonella enterica subsp. enterica serovar Muenster]